MRYYIDISNCKYITNMTNNSIVIDGNTYRMRTSRYECYTASIPYEWLVGEISCVLANKNKNRLVFSFDDHKDKSMFDKIKYIGEKCTCYLSGYKKSFNRGGGYSKYIVPWTE